MKKSYSLLTISFFSIISVVAQTSGDLKVFKTQANEIRSAKQLFQSLVGEGVVLKSFSITKAQSDEAFGFFEDSKASLGMKKGLIMTTGGITALAGRNTVGNMSNNTHAAQEDRLNVHQKETPCAELEKYLLKGDRTFDACVLEMDVVPTADTLSFNYVFGSEEYDEFVGSKFNDVFAFFISGKDIKGEKNLAVLPGTETPVSINTINNGAAGSQGRGGSNPAYYISNVMGNIAIEYDGLTKLMEIRQPVTPYETYHIRLAIADVSDNAYDSGVLIEGKSIISYEKSYNSLFGKNSCELDAPYKKLLDDLAKVYKNKPGKVLVTGHTDNEGDEFKNMELSCCRANAVADYLKTKGIEASRIIIDCKGETMPVSSNGTDQGKAYNRRVEIKLLGDESAYQEKKKEEIVEEKSKLLTNYPNPFATYTTLEAFITEGTKNAQIMISDMQGNAIKTIFLLERGKTSALFDGSFLPNGTFTASLITDGQVNGSIKMVIAH
jgi:outer membrane protein OmpA-like peptidoglycan-associated protein